MIKRSNISNKIKPEYFILDENCWIIVARETAKKAKFKVFLAWNEKGGYEKFNIVLIFPEGNKNKIVVNVPIPKSSFIKLYETFKFWVEPENLPKQFREDLK